MERHPLPSDAQRLAAALATSAAAAQVAARGLCGVPDPLHCTLIPSEAEQLQAIDLAALGDAHLQPALAWLTGVAAAAAAQVTTSTLLCPPTLPTEQLRWDERRQAHILPAAAAAAWARQVHQLAWAAGPAASEGGAADAAAHVLLYLPTPAWQPLLLERAAVGGSARSSMELDSSSLLLIVNAAPADGSGSSTSSSGSSGSASLEGRLAGRILSWLLQPLATPSSSSSGSSGSDGGAPEAVLQQLQQGLSAACAGDAAAALQRVAATAAAAPDQPITAAMGSSAAEVAAALRLATQQQQQQQQPGGEAGRAGLAAVRGAWAAAHQLLQHPATGAHPAFPAEHSMAVLLPLALPFTLVLAQAVGREAAAWKQRRREQRQQQGRYSGPTAVTDQGKVD